MRPSYYLVVPGVESISREHRTMATRAHANLYESDYHTWALTQAEALRTRCFTKLDLPNLVDEVEDMAKSQERELGSRFAVLLMHLLKWAYQPEARSKNWRLTIKEQRLRANELLTENPGMKAKAPQIFAKAYRAARLEAAKETPLEEEDFPEVNPWTVEQASDDSFWPENPAPQGNGDRQPSSRRRRVRGRI